jgi:hypothetical protein
MSVGENAKRVVNDCRIPVSRPRAWRWLDETVLSASQEAAGIKPLQQALDGQPNASVDRNCPGEDRHRRSLDEAISNLAWEDAVVSADSAVQKWLPRVELCSVGRAVQSIASRADRDREYVAPES